MPKITPALTPGHSVPSRSNNLTPRARAMMSSTGSPPTERVSACSIGGTSGSTSLTAIWLNPQDRHSISISATAPGLSGRPAELNRISFDDIDPRGRLDRRVVVGMIPKKPVPDLIQDGLPVFG